MSWARLPWTPGRLSACLVIVPFVVLGDVPLSAADQTPLSTGTAGASMAMSFGLEAAFANPAHLGWQEPSRVQFRVFGLGAGLSNNGFGWGDYRRYNGAEIGDADKQEMLAKVPADGLRILADGSATAMATRVGRWSVYASAFGSVGSRIDRDVLELLLYGNALRPDWQFDASNAEGMAAWKIVLSHGRPIGRLLGRTLFAGVSVSHIQGLYYARSESADAQLETRNNGLTGTAAMDWITAQGGSGWGVDMGLAWEPRDQWVASVKLENLVHHVRWNTNTRVTHFDLAFDDLTVDNFNDSLWVAEETSEPTASFSRGLPVQIQMGLAHLGNRLKASTQLSVSLAERFASSTTPRMSGGVEYAIVPAVPLRFGLATGGGTGFALGWGGGLRFGGVRLEAGIQVDRGLWIGYGRSLTGSLALDVML